MSFFSHVNGGGISTVIPPGDEPRDPRTGRRLVDMTAGQLAIVYERNPELRKLGIVPADQCKHPDQELRGTWNGETIIDIGKRAREAALLRDPGQGRLAPTKPTTTIRTPERTVGVAFHEAFHAAAALHNGVRVLGVTIVRDGGADGMTTMLLDRKDCPMIYAYVALAGEEGDRYCGCPMDPSTYESDRDIGGYLSGARQSEPMCGPNYICSAVGRWRSRVS